MDHKRTKLRVWDIEAKQMFYKVGIIGEDVFIDIDNTKVYDAVGTTEDYYLKIMQNVGLKDNEGIELFEGDIIHWFLRDKEKGLVDGSNKVYYGEGAFRINERYTIGDITDKGNFIILGNMYEGTNT